MNEFEQIKNYAKLEEYAAAKLQRANRGGDYVCPNCNSGAGGENSDSALQINGELFKCFSCGFSGDIYTLCGAVEHIEPKSRACLEAVADFAGVRLEDNKKPAGGSAICRKASLKAQGGDIAPEIIEGRIQAQESLRHYQDALLHDKSPKAQTAREYAAARGFDMQAIQTLGLGYNEKRNALVIPYEGAPYYYNQRRIKPIGNQHKYIKPKKEEVGEQPLYNAPIIDKEKFIFLVVEGELDAASLKILGFDNVLGLCGTGGANQLITKLIERKEQTGNAPIVALMFDNDKDPEKGQKAQRETKQRLNENGLLCVDVKLHFERGEYKDANEMYINEPKQLKAQLLEQMRHAVANRDQLEHELSKNKLNAIKELKNPLDVLKSLETLEDETEKISTGIRKLDGYLFGGLEAFLYVLGATSSLGKTTLMLQIADYIAADGVPVLFATIEQSARELIGKSISRISYNLLSSNVTKRNAGLDVELTSKDALKEYEIQHKAHRKITEGKWSKSAIFKAASNEYKQQIAPNMYIYEPQNQPTINDIRQTAETLTNARNRPPVLFLDYLQLLAPQSERDTDKQAIDKNIMTLRQIARDLKTPVFTISSLNRASYSGVVEMSAFKESGAIEYSADVLCGFQPAGMREAVENKDDKGIKKASNKIMKEYDGETISEMSLTILKNRAGSKCKEGIPLKFIKDYHIFEQ